MARRTFPPFRFLRVISAAAAVIALSAGPAVARASGVSTRPGPAACRAGDLRISVPASIPGDPAEGMGKQAWNLVFRDAGRAACALRGWPRVTVRTTAGKTVVTRVGDVSYSNLAAVPERRIILRPGRSAVVTAMSAAAPAGCVSRWVLELTLPGAGHPVAVRPPAGSYVACVGGQLRLSPFYAMGTLTRQIEGLKVSAAPPPFPAVAAAEPPACRTPALRARVSSVVSQADGSVIGLRLSNGGGPCVLPGSWPTVAVHESGHASQVAKLLPDTAALRAGRSLMATYRRGAALALRHGGSVSVALLAPGAGTGTCRRLTSVTIYPSVTALGAGLTVRVAVPVSICGPARILSYLPGRSGRSAMTVARGVLRAVHADPAAIMAGGDSPGFYYGTDSSAPGACGRGPYTEPAGSCGRGSRGPYGAYMGMMGSWANWKGCTTSGLAWNQANYNMANDNLVRYRRGLGAAGYWFAAGPGRDPHYNGTYSEAAAWGVAQAKAALSGLNGRFFGFRYIFLDVENDGTAPDGNGWNTVWNGPCGNKVRAGYIAPQVDYATFSAFRNYIDVYSPYLAGVYSAGGVSYGSWAGIFGGLPIRHTAEWTFTNEQASLTFPSGFSDSGASASWFAAAPAACHLMWQWSGGNGVLNGYGDFDQVDTANYANPACHA